MIRKIVIRDSLNRLTFNIIGKRCLFFAREIVETFLSRMEKEMQD